MCHHPTYDIAATLSVLFNQFRAHHYYSTGFPSNVQECLETFFIVIKNIIHLTFVLFVIRECFTH